MKRMRLLGAILGSAAMICGCGGGSDSATDPDTQSVSQGEQVAAPAETEAVDQAATTSQTAAPTDTPVTIPAADPVTTDPVQAPADVTTDPTEGDDEYSPEVLKTAEGAVRFWVESMAEAKFFAVLYATDAGSPVYRELEKWAAMFEEAEDDPKAKMATAFLRPLFTDPWKDAAIRPVTEQGPRARFDVEWANGKVISLDVNQVNDLWRVIVTNDTIQPAQMDPNAIPQGDGTDSNAS